MFTIVYLNHHKLVISHKLCVEHSNKQQNRKRLLNNNYFNLQTFGSNPLT